MTTSVQLYANNAKTSLSGSIISTDTTISVTDGSLFPNPSTGQFFLVTLEASGILEIIKVQGKSGNTFTNCIRSMEGTLASGFPAGTRVENRATAATFNSFARIVNTATDILSVDLLTSPITSDSNTYICHSVEDSGNPVVAIRNNDTSWRFLSHPTVFKTGVVDGITFTTLTSSSLVGLQVPLTAGQYILQFTSGPATGTARMLTVTAAGSVTWGTALVILPYVGDTYELYKSLTSSITTLTSVSSDDGMIYSIILSD